MSRFLILASLLFSSSCFAQCLRGDANCDGLVNNFDIDPFIAALLQQQDMFSSVGGTVDCWNNRSCWGDVNQSDAFDNFDIDPFVDCMLGGYQSDQGCGITRGSVLAFVNPNTNGQFLVYVPVDFDPTVHMTVVSLPGTASTKEQEMGPHNRYGTGWPDCGSRTWQQLADDRANYAPFAVIIPTVAYTGATATICNMMADSANVTSMVQYLQHQKIIGSNVVITGWSSGGSLALVIGQQHYQVFSQIVVRYSPMDEIQYLNYDLSTVPNGLDLSTECVAGQPVANWGATVTGNYNWQTDVALRNQWIKIINNDYEMYGSVPEWVYSMSSINSLTVSPFGTQSRPAFTRISLDVYHNVGGVVFFDCDANSPDAPYGAHVEARELALEYFFSH